MSEILSFPFLLSDLGLYQIRCAFKHTLSVADSSPSRPQINRKGLLSIYTKDGELMSPGG